MELREHELYNMMASSGVSHSQMERVIAALGTLTKIVERQSKKIELLQKKVKRLERKRDR